MIYVPFFFTVSGMIIMHVDASVARRPWRGHLARPKARGHLARGWESTRTRQGLPSVGIRTILRRPGVHAETHRRHDITARVCGCTEFFRVPLFDWIKQ
jgi:hypothetical protein